jgi:hypothetical protein
MTLRIDQKEELIRELCEQYGLSFMNTWGRYYISVKKGRKESWIFDFTRVDLSLWDSDQIEENVLSWVLRSGLW